MSVELVAGRGGVELVAGRGGVELVGGRGGVELVGGRAVRVVGELVAGCGRAAELGAGLAGAVDVGACHAGGAAVVTELRAASAATFFSCASFWRR